MLTAAAASIAPFVQPHDSLYGGGLLLVPFGLMISVVILIVAATAADDGYPKPVVLTLLGAACALGIASIIGGVVYTQSVEDRADENAASLSSWEADAAEWASDVYGVDDGIEEMLPASHGRSGPVVIDGAPLNATLTFIGGDPFLMTSDTNAELPRLTD